MSQDFIFDELALLRSRCRRDDRRRERRMRCKGIAEVTLLSLGKRLPGSLVDLSLSGCCIRTETPMPDLEHPTIEVQIAVDGTVLRVAGVVRNLQNHHRLGIQFVDVTRRKADQIRELIAELIERASNCRAESEGRRVRL